MPDDIKPFSPGSDEAIKSGCVCPVFDNGHGKGSGYSDENGNPLFWYDANCPIHGKAKAINKNAKIFGKGISE